MNAYHSLLLIKCSEKAACRGRKQKQKYYQIVVNLFLNRFLRVYWPHKSHSMRAKQYRVSQTVRTQKSHQLMSSKILSIKATSITEGWKPYQKKKRMLMPLFSVLLYCFPYYKYWHSPLEAQKIYKILDFTKKKQKTYYLSLWSLLLLRKYKGMQILSFVYLNKAS